MPNDLSTTPVPLPVDGLENPYGNIVPMRYIRPEVQLQDQLVRDLLARAERLRQTIAAEKAAMLADVRSFLAILDEKYGVKRTGQRGGTTLDSFDGRRRVVISVGDSITLGPEISAARALIDECIGRWAVGANANLKVIVDDAFKVGESGKLAVDRVLGLRRIEIDDDTWRQAMLAINDAVQVSRSREYLRLYQRETADARMEQVAIDWSKL